MGADYNLMKGAYMAAGGHIPGYGLQQRSNLMNFAQGLFDTVAPVIQHRANIFDTWAAEELANVEPMKAEEYKRLQDGYQEKRKRFLLGGPAEQGMMMSEMYRDKQDFDAMKNIRRKVANQGQNKISGYGDNIRFKGGPELESLVKSMNGAPKRNEAGQLGYMMWDREQGQNVFKTFTEINKWLDDWSRDPKTAAAIESYLKETGEQSMSLPFGNSVYDWQGAYRDVYQRIVKHGDLVTLNEYENAPGRVFRDDFIAMCQNLKYEDLGVETGQPTTGDFLALGDGDRDRLRGIIDKLDPTADGKVSEDDAIAIYNAMVEHQGLNQEYLSAYITNLGEEQWLYARNFRADAPQEVNSPAVWAGEGEYDDLGAPGKYKYRVNPKTGNWETFSNEKEQWVDLSDNERAVNKLNEWYPKATEGKKDYFTEIKELGDNLDDDAASVLKGWWDTRSVAEQKELSKNKDWKNTFDTWLVENGYDAAQFNITPPGEDANKDNKPKPIINEEHFLADENSKLFESFAYKFEGERIAMDNPKIVRFLNNNPDIKRMLEDKTMTNREKFNKLWRMGFLKRPIDGTINKEYA